MMATWAGQTNVVRGFLEHKWRSQQLGKFLRLHLALAIAARQGNHDIYGLISQKLSLAELHKAMTNCHKKHKGDDTFNKTPLEWAVKNQDKYLVSELLRHEFMWHKDSKEEGLHCLHSQLTYEDSLKPIITQFTDQYPKMPNEKRMAGLIPVLPMLITFTMYFYDIVFDGVLTEGYYSCSILAGSSDRPEKCEGLNRQSYDYRIAFASIVLFMAISLGASLFMVAMSTGFRGMIEETRYHMYGRHHKDVEYR